MRLRNVISPSSHAAQRIGNALLFISIGILVLSLIGAGRLRLNLPHEPMLWPDSFGYLTPGLLKESSGVWSPTVREFLYPEFVYQITRLTGSTGAVVTVQHGLGLASGLVLAWAWVLFIRPLWPRRIFHGLACLLGAAMLEAYWSSPSLLLYECFLMPEVLFLTLSTVEAVVLAWVVGRITTGRIPGGKPGLFAPLSCLIVVNTMLYFAVPRWGLAAATVPMAVLGLAWCFGFRWRQLLPPLAAGAALAGLGLATPQAVLARTGTGQNLFFVQMHLFGMHVHLIRAELARELAEPAPPYDPVLLRECLASIDREIDRSSKSPAANSPYPTLGFSPEEIINGDSAVALIARYFKNDPIKIRDFFTHYYWAVWRHQPLNMAIKIGRELTYYYAIPSQGLSTTRVTYELAPLATASAQVADQPSYRGLLAASPAWSSYSKRVVADNFTRAIEHNAFGLAVERAGSLLLLPLIGLVCLGSAWVLIWRRDLVPSSPELQVLLSSGVLALLPFSANGTVALLHSLYPPRYQQTNFTLSLLSVALALAAVAAVASKPIAQALAGRKHPI